jgi:hypothetical protein
LVPEGFLDVAIRLRSEIPSSLAAAALDSPDLMKMVSKLFSVMLLVLHTRAFRVDF